MAYVENIASEGVMWVLFDPRSLEVKKTFLDKTEATKWLLYNNKQRPDGWKLEIEQFETGKLDQWLMLKTLRKE